MTKLRFSVYELLGTQKTDDNITLGVLTQENTAEEKTDLHESHMLPALKAKFGPNVTQHEKTILTNVDFELSNDSVASDSYLEKIRSLLKLLAHGVEIFIVERNLGFTNDIAVFDIEPNPITQDESAKHWILISSENSLGSGKYETCPFVVGFKDKTNEYVEKSILYTKKDIISIMSAISIAYDTTIQNTDFARLNSHKHPKSLEALKLALDNLAEAIKDNNNNKMSYADAVKNNNNSKMSYADAVKSNNEHLKENYNSDFELN